MIWLLSMFGCQPHPVLPSGPMDSVPGHLVIAHTNDIHAHFEPNRAEWLPGEPAIGGFGEISGLVSQLHKEKGDDHVLYLDGGDMMTGTPLMEFEVNGVRGGAMMDFTSDAGMDAWVLGNHEFDIGFDHISALVGASKVPVLSANLDHVNGSGQPAIDGLKDHIIIQRAGVRVGIFGLTTDSLARLTGTDATDHMVVRDVVEVAREQVAALVDQVDLVVALTHVGLDTDQRIAGEVPGIDLIVGGHSHTPLVEPVQVGDTWIVQAGCYARQLGVTEMDVVDGNIVNFSAKLVDLTPGAVEVPEASATLMQTWKERIDGHFAEIIGRVEGATLDRSKNAETPLGRWAADMVRSAAGTDIGIYNPGGLRADLVAGPLTRGGLYQVFPFSNDVVQFDVSGEQVVGLLLKNAGSEISGRHPVMQLSGVAAQWRLRAGAPELVSVTVGETELDPDAVYTAATNSYVTDRWQYNLGFEPTNQVPQGLTVFEAAVARAQAGVIVSPSSPRMTRSE
jgi:2',3'-cyclic-nucleotide 2'-phosphodiesterase (5'-nucleotidase family)